MNNIISEYGIKKLLGLDIIKYSKNDYYDLMDVLHNMYCDMNNTKYVIKVDKIDKKIKLNVDINEMVDFVNKFDYKTFLIEPFYEIERKDYIVIEKGLIFYGYDIDKKLTKMQLVNDNYNAIVKKLFDFYMKYHLIHIKAHVILTNYKLIPIKINARWNPEYSHLFYKYELDLLIG